MPDHAPRHRPAPRARSRSARVVRLAGAALVTVLVVAALTVTVVYRHYAGQIHHVANALNTTDPNIRDRTRQLHADNFLVIGSDTRAGADSAYGDTGGARSDTTMLVHLSPDRARATVVSFPRDSWVPIPACKSSSDTRIPAHTGQFNSAFSDGGAGCTVATVQELTGISVTHYVQIDFSGFKAIVSSLGAITVCSPTAVDDPNSTLRLHAGNNLLSADQALAYVRARETLGDGSDLGRIQRQQRFLGAVLREARGGHLLTHLPSFLDAATKALTVDPGTTPLDLKRLVDVLRGLDPSKVTFYTAPIANPAYNPDDPSQPGGRVLLDPTVGRTLYDSIIRDQTKTVGPSSSAPRPSPSPSKPAALTVTVAPSAVEVAVTNGVGTTDLATDVSDALAGVGFRRGVLGLEPQDATTTTVRFAPSQLAAARTVAAAIPGSVLAQDAAHTGDVEVIIGSSYRGVTRVAVGDKLPSSLQPSGGTPTGRSSTPTTSAVPTGISAADTSCTE